MKLPTFGGSKQRNGGTLKKGRQKGLVTKPLKLLVPGELREDSVAGHMVGFIFHRYCVAVQE